MLVNNRTSAHVLSMLYYVVDVLFYTKYNNGYVLIGASTLVANLQYRLFWSIVYLYLFPTTVTILSFDLF